VAGDVVYSVVDCNCTVVGWEIIGDVSGSAVVDVWYNASALPTVSDKISGTGSPTLSSAQSATGGVGSWGSVTLAKGGYIAYKLSSASTVKRVSVFLQVVKR